MCVQTGTLNIMYTFAMSYALMCKEKGKIYRHKYIEKKNIKYKLYLGSMDVLGLSLQRRLLQKKILFTFIFSKLILTIYSQYCVLLNEYEGKVSSASVTFYCWNLLNGFCSFSNVWSLVSFLYCVSRAKSVSKPSTYFRVTLQDLFLLIVYARSFLFINKKNIVVVLVVTSSSTL